MSTETQQQQQRTELSMYAPSPELLAELAGTVTAVPSASPTGIARQGDRYEAEHHATASQVAAALRSDMNAAVRRAVMPGAGAGVGYRVRAQRYGRRRAVEVHVVEHGSHPDDYGTPLPFLRRATPADVIGRPDQRLSVGDLVIREDVALLGKALRAMADRYVRMDADPETDYLSLSCRVDIYLGRGGRWLA